MASPTQFELMAHTMDDACGESFDKVAKLFDLGYPGGPIIEKRAREGRSDAFAMPVMMEQKSRLAFSYSGLKTFIVNLKRKLGEGLTGQQINDICACFQEAALGQLVRKIQAALELKPDCRSVLIAGGVAANQRFRAMMAEKVKVPAIFPALKYCADNAAMIGSYGYYLYRQRLEEQGSGDFGLAWDAYSRYRFPG
jgi:N6-L-threonylcarbamoyladenine synthase